VDLVPHLFRGHGFGIVHQQMCGVAPAARIALVRSW
jgi:hypothetical protein